MTTEVQAPLAGNIWQILVAVGDEIEEDDEVVVIEALKMEHPVYAPCGGKVSGIRVKEGDAVEDEQVLMTID